MRVQLSVPSAVSRKHLYSAAKHECKPLNARIAINSFADILMSMDDPESFARTAMFLDFPCRNNTVVQ